MRLEGEKDIWAALNIIKEKGLNVEKTEKLIDSLCDNKVKAKRNVVRVFRDVRIFVNTVNKAIETMKASGIDAETDRTETDDYIEFRVKIPKTGINEPTLKVLKANSA